MNPLAIQAALEKTRRTLADYGLQTVYLLVYDPETKQFAAIAGDTLGGHERLRELVAYAEKELAV